jgi:hypothetical protein
MTNQKQKTAGTSIVDASIERSVFGVFSKHYKNYKKKMEGKKDTMEIWKSYFVGSEILSDVYRCLLYFNLPEEIIDYMIKPVKLFSIDRKHSTSKEGSNYLNDMLNMFEQEKDEKTRKANVILLQIPRSNNNFGPSQSKDEYEIIGGYASHGWAVSQSQKHQGNESCFLFNLT